MPTTSPKPPATPVPSIPLCVSSTDRSTAPTTAATGWPPGSPVAATSAQFPASAPDACDPPAPQTVELVSAIGDSDPPSWPRGRLHEFRVFSSAQRRDWSIPSSNSSTCPGGQEVVCARVLSIPWGGPQTHLHRSQRSATSGIHDQGTSQFVSGVGVVAALVAIDFGRVG